MSIFNHYAFGSGSGSEAVIGNNGSFVVEKNQTLVIATIMAEANGQQILYLRETDESGTRVFTLLRTPGPAHALWNLTEVPLILQAGASDKTYVVTIKDEAEASVWLGGRHGGP